MGHGGAVLSYALNQRVFACGHQAETIAVGASGSAVTVNVDGINKARDTILVTLDINGDTDAAVTLCPYEHAAPLAPGFDGTSFTADLAGVSNNGASEITVFLNWAVIR